MTGSQIVDLKSITPEEALGGVGGLSVLWLFFKKVVLRTAVDNTAINAADAQSEVITILRSEVSRLGEVNTLLAEKLNAAQLKNVDMLTEMSALRDKLNQVTEQFNIMVRRYEDLAQINHTDRRGGS